MNSFICLSPSFLLFVLLTFSWFENGQPAQFIRDNLMWLILPIIFFMYLLYRGARIRFLAPAIIGAGLLPLALNVVYVQTFVSR